MNKIELIVRYHFSEWYKGDDKKFHVAKEKKREKKLEFSLYSEDETNQLISLLRMVDEDFDKRFGAWDKNLRYEIIDIVFNNGTTSGTITREVLDNKLGYQRLYPSS